MKKSTAGNGGIYNQPRYYDIVALGYENPKKQADYFEAVAKRYGIDGTRSFLDIACGTSPQLIELAKRGYACTGLDMSKKMLAYLSEKARREGLKVGTVKANILDFRLRKKYDFAFVLSDSIDVKTNKQLLKHLDCVGRALKRGGVYLIEDMSFGPHPGRKPEVYRHGRTIITYYSKENKVADELGQLNITNMNMVVKESGKTTGYNTTYAFKVFYPQEFLSLVEISGKFRFIGWFEHLSFRPLKRIARSNIIILKKR